MTTRRYLANAIRALSMDAVEKAQSGHPGMPMGMADIAEVLWNDFLRFNPKNPNWANRDRFVLSNGHGSMLLYSILHLTGYDLSIEDLRAFRQLHSKTAGHPEYAETPGVETTTGPLGQGIANAVGMAIAEQKMAHDFNRDKFNIVDHHTYAFVGDGCLMEGVSHEACELAGTLGLGKLIVIWDDNGISIDGKVANWFSTDVAKRFSAYNWQVIEKINGHDAAAIADAIKQAKDNTIQPTLICCKTTIGFGSPNKAGSAASHGAPLGSEEIAAAKAQLEWPHAAFEIPPDIYAAYDGSKRGQQLEDTWQNLFDEYGKTHPQLASEFNRRVSGELPDNWQTTCDNIIANYNNHAKSNATRKSSLEVLNALQPILPEILGGSADLSGSNCTKFSNAKSFARGDCSGNYIHYGVREFGMSAMMNGICLHGGLIPYGGTFLVFSDYARNAVRLSAMMQQKVIYVYSHDSIGLGEDGPTHQPIEHAASLRLIPGLDVWRPADATETAVAWQCMIEANNPSCILLTRQNVEQYHREQETLTQVARGAYTLLQVENADTVIMATGSEVEIAMHAAKQLNEQGHKVNVVSMPCLDRFDQQDEQYKKTVLPDNLVRRFAIEAGSTDLWYKYVGNFGKVFGINRFGISAPYEQAYAELGLTVDNIVKQIGDYK